MTDQAIRDTGIYGRLQANSLKEWNARIPMPPDAALAILTRDLPPETVVNLIILDDGTGNISMSAPGVFSCDGTTFKLQWHELHPGVLVVKEQEQGQSTGRHVVRNQIEFFRRCGVSNIHAEASKDAGGYTWARFGFLPDDIEDYDFSMTRYQVGGRLNLLRKAFDEVTAERLEEAAAFESEKDLWRIADAGADVGPALRAMSDDQREAFAKFFDRDGGKKAVSTLFSMAQAGRPVPAGRALLAGTQWKGHINTNNAAQMNRVNHYCR
jgi:hypothetical protein